ncbi:hypothetical protein FB451DRAFT_1564230 [Mycena latifolia]|nr:hypothetical protein FB451DRAFT_1564230 [Mycena latifolia]
MSHWHVVLQRASHGYTAEMTHHPPYEDVDDKESLNSSTHTIVGDLQRVADLWFEDATLILRAEDTIFRISRGILAARSSVLKARMCGLAQSSADMLYGCPVLEIQHSPVDVTNFLKAIFDSDFFLPPPARSPFSVVIGVLALAHEYNVAYLFRRALRHFETFFPSTLDGERIHDGIVEGSKVGASTLSCYLLALQAASDVGALWNVPSIIYECCTFTLAEITSGDTSTRERKDMVPRSQPQNVGGGA